MSKSLTSNVVPANKDQVRRVRTLSMEAIEASLEEGGFTHGELQAVHANGGVFKQELGPRFLGFVREFASRIRNVVRLAITAIKDFDFALPAGWVWEPEADLAVQLGDYELTFEGVLQ